MRSLLLPPRKMFSWFIVLLVCLYCGDASAICVTQDVHLILKAEYWSLHIVLLDWCCYVLKTDS